MKIATFIFDEANDLAEETMLLLCTIMLSEFCNTRSFYVCSFVA